MNLGLKLKYKLRKAAIELAPTAPSTPGAFTPGPMPMAPAASAASPRSPAVPLTPPAQAPAIGQLKAAPAVASQAAKPKPIGVEPPPKKLPGVGHMSAPTPVRQFSYGSQNTTSPEGNWIPFATVRQTRNPETGQWVDLGPSEPHSGSQDMAAATTPAAPATPGAAGYGVLASQPAYTPWWGQYGTASVPGQQSTAPASAQQAEDNLFATQLADIRNNPELWEPYKEGLIAYGFKTPDNLFYEDASGKLLPRQGVVAAVQKATNAVEKTGRSIEELGHQRLQMKNVEKMQEERKQKADEARKYNASPDAGFFYRGPSGGIQWYAPNDPNSAVIGDEKLGQYLREYGSPEMQRQMGMQFFGGQANFDQARRWSMPDASVNPQARTALQGWYGRNFPQPATAEASPMSPETAMDPAAFDQAISNQTAPAQAPTPEQALGERIRMAPTVGQLIAGMPQNLRPMKPRASRPDSYATANAQPPDVAASIRESTSARAPETGASNVHPSVEQVQAAANAPVGQYKALFPRLSANPGSPTTRSRPVPAGAPSQTTIDQQAAQIARARAAGQPYALDRYLS